MKIEKVEVKEIELEELIIHDLGEIDEGLNFLGNQIDTDSGRLDILAVDEDGTVAILELKVKEDDYQLFQGITYFDWVKSRIEWISRSYAKEYDHVIDPNKDPWLILVAPSFSENTMRVARYMDVMLNLFTYNVIKVGKEKKVLFTEIDYGEPYEPIEVPTIQGHLDWMDDENAKDLLKDAIKKFEDLGIDVRPKKRRISLFHKGKRIARIQCRKKSFHIKNYLPEDDYTKTIENINDLSSYIDDHLIPFL